MVVENELIDIKINKIIKKKYLKKYRYPELRIDYEYQDEENKYI